VEKRIIASAVIAGARRTDKEDHYIEDRGARKTGEVGRRGKKEGVAFWSVLADELVVAWPGQLWKGAPERRGLI